MGAEIRESHRAAALYEGFDDHIAVSRQQPQQCVAVKAFGLVKRRDDVIAVADVAVDKVLGEGDAGFFEIDEFEGWVHMNSHPKSLRFEM